MSQNEELVTEIVYSPSSQWFRYLIVQVGARLSAGILDKLDSIINSLTVGNWLRSRRLKPVEWASGRPDLFRRLAALKNLDSKEVLYLEFGVYKGASIRFWSELLKNKESRLFGFDTFEGLPEGWKVNIPEGTFSTGGMIPELTDRRIQFVKGRFKDTLAKFKVPDHKFLVINIDSDLYSSAWEVFSALDSDIRPGTIIYFDDISDRQNEMRAFEESMIKSSGKFKLLVADRCCYHMAFEKMG